MRNLEFKPKPQVSEIPSAVLTPSPPALIASQVNAAALESENPQQAEASSQGFEHQALNSFGHDFAQMNVFAANSSAAPDDATGVLQRQIDLPPTPSRSSPKMSSEQILVARAYTAETAQPNLNLGDEIRAASTGGNALEPQTRAQLEPGLGADLSGVRLHTDSRSDQLSRSVNAVAFTTGQDIFFRQGAYNPASSEGIKLLAHEATHTIQQSRGTVSGTPLTDGVSVSDPNDSFEQEAESSAAKVVAGHAAPGISSVAQGVVQRKAENSSNSELVIQRYQAGDSGHGGIEIAALKGAGFSDNEATKAYLGNWMRDISQLTDSPWKAKLVQLLTLGEFGYEVTLDQLGTYVASEHLDNPAGGGTIEDPEVLKLEHDPDPAKQKLFQDAYNKLGSDQRAEYERRKTQAAAITKSAKSSGLPEYIERGKLHSKDKLVEAFLKKRTPEGLQMMGNALHGVEDYFSHSNFVEAAIFELYSSGAPVGHLVKQMSDTTLGADAPFAGGKMTAADGPAGLVGKPKIVTGTYAPGGNDTVSKLETLKTQVHEGQLVAAAIKGAAMKLGLTIEDIGKAVGAKIGAPIGGVLGAAAGGVAGASRGARRGGRIGGGIGRFVGGDVGEWLGEEIGEGVGGVVGGVGGAVDGWDSGKAAGARTGAELLQMVGHLVGIGIQGEAIMGISFTAGGIALFKILFPGVSAVIAGSFDAAIEHYIDEATKKSATEAKAKGLTGPTHSELAKDAPDHKLFGVSAALAQIASRDIGAAMATAWASVPASSGTPATPSPAPGTPTPATPTPSTPTPSGSLGGAAQTPANQTPPSGVAGTAYHGLNPPPEAKAVMDLVDKFVSHPASNNWWQSTVLAAAAKK